MLELIQTNQDILPEVSAAGLFMLLFFGTFVSEDAACLLAGTAVANGRVGLIVAITSCFLGIFAGDVLLYGVGRLFGPAIFNNRFTKRFITERSISKASAWLENNAASAIFMSRFVSGLRLPTYLAAGALRTDFAKFAAYFLIAAAIWTPVLVGSIAYAQSSFFRANALLGVIVVAVAFRLMLLFLSHRRRRLFVGRLKRIVKWEFWPVQIFYLPVVLYVLFLAVKHRSLTAFTAVNPAMPAGGFKGESKNEIYCGLRQSDAAGEHLLEHTLIQRVLAPHERLLKAWQFIDECDLDFPIVFKPDAGERGKDVTVVGSFDELAELLLEADVDMILQEFVAGAEFSVFYYRYPHEASGRIYSITEKILPDVTGDGRSTLEELILNEGRAVCLAKRYFEQNHDRMRLIPASAERVVIASIGTHSRGAIFLDGSRVLTNELERRIDDICRGFAGFFFGRFDVRSPSSAALGEDTEFKIIELNGVTSESTNIYDPRYSLREAYGILFRQWRIAFEIGAENIKLGAAPAGLVELLRMALGFPVRRNELKWVCGQDLTINP